MTTHDTSQLDHRRRELGMTYETLAQRSGVSVMTVKRMLRKGIEHATFANVAAVAAALGVDIRFVAEQSAFQFRQQAANKAARRIVSLVQSSSALEAQAVDSQGVDEMISQTVHDLMSGPKRNVWGALE
jgi:transcriptional regulator with XRE-family HTH domain